MEEPQQIGEQLRRFEGLVSAGGDGNSLIATVVALSSSAAVT